MHTHWLQANTLPRKVSRKEEALKQTNQAAHYHHLSYKRIMVPYPVDLYWPS